METSSEYSGKSVKMTGTNETLTILNATVPTTRVVKEDMSRRGWKGLCQARRPKGTKIYIGLFSVDSNGNPVEFAPC